MKAMMMMTTLAMLLPLAQAQSQQETIDDAYWDGVQSSYVKCEADWRREAAVDGLAGLLGAITNAGGDAIASLCAQATAEFIVLADDDISSGNAQQAAGDLDLNAAQNALNQGLVATATAKALEASAHYLLANTAFAAALVHIEDANSAIAAGHMSLNN